MVLTSKERRALRARAHGINPAVSIGSAGLTDAVLAETNRALDDHELVKIKVAIDDREERKAAIDRTCERLRAEHVQSLGKTALIFREAPPVTEPEPPVSRGGRGGSIVTRKRRQ